MATETENLKLSKAETSDEILQTLQANNENFDKIDEEITALNEKEFVLPIASNNTLGGIKVGEGLSINEVGTLQVIPQSSGSGITVLEASTENVIDFNTLTEAGIYLVKNASDGMGTTLNSGMTATSMTYDLVLQVRHNHSADGITINQIRYTNVDSFGNYRSKVNDGDWNSWTSSTLNASRVAFGTFTGKVLANATAVATLSNTQVRNIQASTTDLTAGTSTLATGDIYFVYE